MDKRFETGFFEHIDHKRKQHHILEYATTQSDLLKARTMADVPASISHNHRNSGVKAGGDCFRRSTTHNVIRDLPNERPRIDFEL